MESELLRIADGFSMVALFLCAAIFKLFQNHLVKRLFQVVFCVKRILPADKYIHAALQDICYFYKDGQGWIGASALNIGNMAGVDVQCTTFLPGL